MKSDDSPSTLEGRRAWRGWRRRTAIIASAIAFYALLGFFVVPPIARSQIEKLSREFLHRQATVERVRFNPFTLRGQVEGFDLKDRDGSALFKIDRFAADLQVSGLMQRAWRFREVVIEGPDAVLRILADGKLSIRDIFEASKEGQPRGAPTPLPRLLVDRFVLSRGGVGFVDESRSPRFDERLAPLNLEMHGLTTIPNTSGDHAVTLGIGETARLKWTGRQTVEPFSLEGHVDITGMSLVRIGKYLLAGQALEVRQGLLDVACSYAIRQAADGGLNVALTGVTAGARDLAVRSQGGGEDWLVVPKTDVTGAKLTWPESNLEIGAVKITRPHVVAWLDTGGRLNWQAALPSASGPRTATTASVAKPWTVNVGSIEMAGGSAEVEDRTVNPTVTVGIDNVAIRVDNASTDLTAPVQVNVAARVNETAEVTAKGPVVPQPMAANLDVAVHGLDLVPFASYAVKLPGATLRHGVAGASGHLAVGQGSPQLQFDGEAAIDGVQVAGAGTDRLIAWDKVSAKGIHATVAPDTLRIRNVGVDGAFLQLKFDRQRKVNLSELLAENPARDAAPAPKRARFPVEIAAITIRNASADFTDESLILPFSTKIHSANGAVKDLSTISAASARIGVEGRVEETGYVKVDGTMRIADPFASSDVGVIFRGVSMPELTPYTAQFAGYAVKSGKLDLDVRYRLVDRHLVGDQRIVANDLTLGGKVEGGDPPGLPIRLAIALLKDKDGRIDLQVPIEGTVDTPEFAYRTVFWQAFKKILGNLVAAPFRAIGRLFGADKEDLELVGFAAGQSALPAPEREKLAKLAGELAGRSELAIEVEGRFDPVTDVLALRRLQLEQRIDAKRQGEASLESILEALYTESFSAELLNSERAKHQPADPKAAFDAGAFYDALRAQLLAAEQFNQADLDALGNARAAAIVAALTATGGLDPSRAKALAPAPVKKKKRGSELIASEMTMNAKD